MLICSHYVFQVDLDYTKNEVVNEVNSKCYPMHKSNVNPIYTGAYPPKITLYTKQT